ncbi:MAG: phosphoglycerate mutase (2,3-diphosphoglycerate-independent) [Candidatus Magasanikbacteria bacterium RIFCSPHIGHO2_01_FULL_41_23]|uniref:2,3-bisphosphoglycerate-independent phosphoglycerate mutase n=1 Tax=Candidatus Magasanikbacteria bacterium RIFCSPLOWO2_01_FULL_40_15 TaxID=1798686 RepID=A0A1F6N4K0_9BACT|nr:MAG: phosphoglycerate mutase (2,3-diphosphoglycerate-independent) [Candidatus Magasanikbacteria bacterium RIFCSPHIGHO2_01_FULL_41_23]OGH66772.1 MAG: phosphoglycerate mutase (2,3-diphosphoglycerate-independent) [Candidatus Magasanikbacteria bacterium RIFCSPHIGHO2_02_FULL_41_35]OGH74570.1 MAG: phosphoglycerate mutase (2,3-diphosphoglycerate-independent) [Candidatus Magasanikbacteria bacterium RIFCSPHIGHO2_12_FULL_41_16]OGH78859.1 MAG: phosphoglycerate mutase (2,3-diphosphoglycerate-independent)
MNRPKPLVLAILDGWGVAPDTAGNAIVRAKTPNFQKFIREYPTMTLFASGNEVGLSFGEMGNSEVGHLNIGAGRVYYQTLPRLNKSIADHSFFDNKAFLEAAEQVKKNKSNLHLIGLVGPGNVHASQDHLDALLKFAKQQKIKNVFVHAILDGRDATFNSGVDFIKKLQATMKDIGVGKIATLSGRYFGMDRDNRWDRVEKAYRAIVSGIADVYAKDPIKAIKESYAKEVYDEEFVPTVIGEEGEPMAKISDDDSVIFFNFRPDRARQLTQAFVLPTFTKFEREYLKKLCFVTMTEYEKELPVTVAFPPNVVVNCLAQTISDAGLKQYHIAETEKYAHITFFLNGTIEEAFSHEDRKIIPSPKVASYDKAPEMSAAALTKDVVKIIEGGKYDVIMLNLANPDMVAHTGDTKATIKGVEMVDKCLGDIAAHTLAHHGVMLITADHGNAEELVNLQTNERDKEHSTNPVPFIIIGEEYHGKTGPAGDPPDGDLSLLHPVGMLADVAPTVLSILGIKQPKEMTGRALT